MIKPLITITPLYLPKALKVLNQVSFQTDGTWQKSILLNNQLNPDITTILTHTYSFNPDGTFTSTSEVASTANVEFPDYIDIFSHDPITSIGQYTLGESITTQSGLTALSIDLDWQINENNSGITLDIVYIAGTELYLGLPRKLPSCEDIEEPYYEYYDVTATAESATDELNDGIDIGALNEGFIGHTQGCYGRPNAMNFEQSYTHILVITGELEPLVIEPSEGGFTTGELDPETLEQDEGYIPTLELDPSIFNPPLGTYRI